MFLFKAGLPTGYVDKISQKTEEKASTKKVNWLNNVFTIYHYFVYIVF